MILPLMALISIVISENTINRCKRNRESRREYATLVSHKGNAEYRRYIDELKLRPDNKINEFDRILLNHFIRNHGEES